MIIVDHPFCYVRVTSIVTQDSKYGETTLEQRVTQLNVAVMLIAILGADADERAWDVVIETS
jgi:hypothetical protein